MNKKIIIILCILLLFLMISNASASDMNTKDEQIVNATDTTIDNSDVSDSLDKEILKTVNNDSNEILSVDSDNDKLSASIDVTTFSDLSSAVSSKSYSEINIKSNLIATESISISYNNLIINGNGHTITGQNNIMKCFEFNNGATGSIIKNINFINFQTTSQTYASCVHFGTSTNCEVSYCNFTNMAHNSGSSPWGAGIFLGTSPGATIKYPIIDHCRFDTCSAQAGAAVYTMAHSGGNIIQYLMLSNCYFTNNKITTAARGSCIELNAEYSTISNCIFEYNDAGAGSGAIGMYSKAPYTSIINCTFIGNTGTNGAAISSENANNYNLTITNCTFTKNTATGNGAALIVANSYSQITNCTFTNNTAKNGGAVYFNAQYSTLKNCDFENNTATSTGGAVYANAAYSTVDTCTFKNCTAASCNYFYQGSPITFKNTYFPEVYVGGDSSIGDSLDKSNLGTFDTGMNLVETGGTMYIVGSLTNFQNHEVTRGITIKPYTSSSNINLSSVSGRAFTISASDVTIRDLTFTDSKYNGNGGVLYCNGDNAYIYNCTFKNNVLSNHTSSGKGGVIYVTGNSDIFTVEKCTFKDNKAYDGGAIYVDDVTDNTLIYNSEFKGNYATHYGGALYYEGSICYYVDDNTNRDFTSNYAAGNSVYANIYDGEATKCILDVYVSLNGGGDGSTFNTPTNFQYGFKLVAPNGKITFVRENEIYNLGEDYRISKFNVTFIGNHSTLNDASFTITPTSHSIKFYNLIFKGNTEYTIIWNGVNGIVENCIFKDNGGNNGLKGVAIQAYGDNLQVKNSVFDNNRALTSGADGGAIWCNATNLKIINSNFTNNKASASGIHIYLAESATYTIIKDSSFINGTRTGTGSAIILTNGSLDIYNTLFDRNTGEYGGALRLLNGTANINGSTFTRNQATYGGAIYTNITLKLTNSNLTSNTADYGGALYINNKKVIMSDLRFENNYAFSGAAIYFNTTNEITFKNLSFISNSVRDNAIVYFTNSANVYNDEYVRFTNNNLGSGLLNTFVANNGKINATVFYVANEATGTGLTWGKDATTLDYALEHIFENGKIFFSPGEYDLDKITITQNIALVGNQTTLKRKSADKYLFIPLSQFI